MNIIKMIANVLKRLATLVAGVIATEVVEVIAMLQLAVWWINLIISVTKAGKEYARTPIEM